MRTATEELADRLDELSPRVPDSYIPDLDRTKAAERVALAHEVSRCAPEPWRA